MSLRAARSGFTVRLSAGYVVLLLVLALGCGREDFRDANIVIVGIDTLRADHVGAYGYARPTTPRIDAFSKDAVKFTTAVSQSSWTLPAFASMLTGLLPSYHRAGEGAFPSVSYLDPSVTTLPTVLHEAGFHTASFVSNVWVGAEVGMTQGYDEHKESMLSEEAASNAVKWLGAHRAERLFLFVHIMAPHQPYWPGPEDAAPFIDPAYTGPVGMSFIGDVDPKWTDADRRRVVDLYDGDIHFADRLTGQVLDAIAELGLDRKTIVVVIADHGEELFDHGHLSHGNTLYDE